MLPFKTRVQFVTASALLAAIAVAPNASQIQAAPLSQTFTLTGSSVDFTIPAGVTSLTFDANGADAPFGGNGARVTGTITVTPNEVLRIYVGGRGSSQSGAGGFPNGGYGGGALNQLMAFGGGGSTHIVATDINETPIVVAGGGGGGTNYGIGGAGGYVGDDGSLSWVTYTQLDGRGGTQSAGGAETCDLSNVCYASTRGTFMQGGEGRYGAGGGGGYWGGSGGNGDENVPDGGSFFDYGGTGGGGSSYVQPSRIVGQSQPTYVTGANDGDGFLVLTWTPAAPTTIAASTIPALSSTVPTPATTTSPPASSSGSGVNGTITTLVEPSTTSTTSTTMAPTWTSQPEVEREESIVGRTPFPSSGRGSVVVVNEGGYVVNAKNVFTPRWRTRVYIGTFKFSLKATYSANKKKRTYACTFPKFGTESRIAASRKWRWYSPPRGCTLPKELVAQLAQGKTTMQFTGSFTRKWATSGKSTRPDGSRIDTLRISLVIAGSDSVALN